jgi:hypothetical protein
MHVSERMAALRIRDYLQQITGQCTPYKYVSHEHNHNLRSERRDMFP